MPDDAFKRKIWSMFSDADALDLVTIDHADSSDPGLPVRLVNKSAVAVVGPDGETYQPFTFRAVYPSQGEPGISRAQVIFDNITREITDKIRMFPSMGEPTLRVEIVSSADPSVLQRGPYLYTLRVATFDRFRITGELWLESILNEPIAPLFSPGNFPGMF